jgi:peptidyl-prolyl cis-trans isomerase C
MMRIAPGWIYRCLPAAGLLALGLGLGGSGCDKKTPAAEMVQTPAVGTPAVPPKEDKVVVTVNGTPIRESQVQKRLDLRYKPLLDRYRAQDPKLAAEREKEFRQQSIQQLITRQLVEDQAQAARIQVTDNETTAEMTQQLSSRRPPATIEEFQKYVQAQGGDFEAIKASVGDDLKLRRLVEVEAALTAVTEAEAKKYYDEHPQQFQTPEQVRASHILIKPAEPSTDPNQAKARAKAKAEELLRKVRAGADFATLAKENSECPSKVQGGDLGLFARGRMIQPFSDAAFALKVGEISDVVETRFGYHIIKVTEHHDPNQIPFEQAKTALLERLTQQQRQQATGKYLQALRQEAKIVYSAGYEPSVPPAARPKPVVSAPAPAPSPTAAPAPTPVPAPVETRRKQ